MRRRLFRAALGSLVLFAGLLSASAFTNAASAAPTFCNGQPAQHIAKMYSLTPPFLPQPMRCGTSSYGYNHIKSRYNSDPLFDYGISYTLENPIAITGSGTSDTFQAYAQACGGTYFRVVIEFASYSDGKSKGLITAYYTNSPLASPTKVFARPRSVQPQCG